MPNRLSPTSHWILVLIATMGAGCSADQHRPGGKQPTSSAHPRPPAAVNSRARTDSNVEQSQAEQFADEAFVMHQTLSVYLLGKASVQDELALSDDQKDEVAEIITTGIGEFYGLKTDASQRSDGDPMPSAIQSALPIAKRVEKQLRDMLQADQHARLKQLVWRTNAGPVTFVRTGPLVLLHPEVDEALELTADQRASIVAIAANTFQAISESSGIIFTGAGVRKLLQDGRRRAEAVLTNSQREEWAALQGPPPKD